VVVIEEPEMNHRTIRRPSTIQGSNVVAHLWAQSYCLLIDFSPNICTFADFDITSLSGWA
jgi:hypothetical protein